MAKSAEILEGAMLGGVTDVPSDSMNGTGGQKQRPFNAWMPFNLFQTRTDASQGDSCTETLPPTIGSFRPLYSLIEEDDIGEHFEDAHNSPPSSPIPNMIDNEQYQWKESALQGTYTAKTVKCASTPLIAKDTWRRHVRVLKRSPTTLDLTSIENKSKFSPNTIGGGDHFTNKLFDGRLIEDSDDEDLSELDPKAMDSHAMRRSLSSTSTSTFRHSGDTLERTSNSATDLHTPSSGWKSSQRSPARHHRSAVGNTSGQHGDDLRDPPTAVLVDLDTDETPAPNPLDARTVRSAMLRLKGRLISGELTTVDLDSLEAVSPCGSGDTYIQPGRSSVAYESWLRNKRLEDATRHELKLQAEEQRRMDEVNKETEAEKKKEEEKVSFRFWVQKKNQMREQARKVEEEMKRLDEETKKDRKIVEQQISHKSIAKWKEKKDRELKERLAAKEKADKETEEEKEKRKMMAAQKFSEWLEKHRDRCTLYSQPYINPEPWVDVVPPPSMEEVPAPRQKRRIRCRSCRSQRRAAERLSQPSNRRSCHQIRAEDRNQRSREVDRPRSVGNTPSAVSLCSRPKSVGNTLSTPSFRSSTSRERHAFGYEGGGTPLIAWSENRSHSGRSQNSEMKGNITAGEARPRSQLSIVRSSTETTSRGTSLRPVWK